MKTETITLYYVESEHGETIARCFSRSEAQQFAAEQQRLRGRTPVDPLHVVPREFVQNSRRQ